MRSLFLLVGPFLVLLTSHAQAQSRLTRGDGVLYCEPFVTCESDAQCAELEPHCEPLATGETVCTAHESTRYELLCCESSEQCGARSDVAGTCVTFTDEENGQEPVGVCLYHGIFDLCLEAGETATFADAAGCFDASLGSLSSLAERYRVGDCDGDGVQNDIDPCPCSPEDACLVGEDGGVGSDDAGKVSVQAGISGGGGCSAAPSPGPWAIMGVLGALILRRRRSSRPTL
jgi:uncharacterized protein (TIGR03382 family)